MCVVRGGGGWGCERAWDPPIWLILRGSQRAGEGSAVSSLRYAQRSRWDADMAANTLTLHVNCEGISLRDVIFVNDKRAGLKYKIRYFNIKSKTVFFPYFYKHL